MNHSLPMDQSIDRQPLRSDATEAPQAPLIAGQGPSLRRVLVCLDRSQLAEASLPAALFVGKSFGSAVTLVHVMQPRDARLATDALGWEIARQEARVYLERLEQQAAEAGTRVETRLEQGHPAARIADLARELESDLIVLGRFGEGGVTGCALGSTAQQVLALAHASVFIARPGHAEFSPRRVLVPLDGSIRTEAALRSAVQMARSNGGELVLVHVVEEPVPSRLLRVAEDLELARELATRLEKRATEYLEQVRRRLASEISGVRIVVLRSTDTRQALLEVCAKEQIDLVVLSAHGATCNRQRSFGSVTTHMLSHSAVPLMVLQDIDAGAPGSGFGSSPPPALLSRLPREVV